MSEFTTTEPEVIGGGLADAFAQPSVADEAKPKPLLEQLAEARQEMLAETVELRLPFPTWRKRLVGVFTPLTKAERRQLEKADNERKLQRIGAEERQRLSALHMIATTCRRVEFDGKQVDGSTVVSGFTAEFGESIGADPDDVLDIVWTTLHKNEELFGRVCLRLNRWFADPEPADLTDADPFGSI